MGKDLSTAARNTSSKAQATSKDRFDKADTLLAKKEKTVTAKNTKSTSKKKEELPLVDPIVRRDCKLLQSEDKLLESIMLRGGSHGVLLNKSEVLRAGLKALDRQTDRQLKATLTSVERLVRGRK
jgi:hypothetical protein